MKIIAIDDNRIMVEINEKLSPNPLEVNLVETNPILQADNIRLIYPDLNQLLKNQYIVSPFLKMDFL